MTSTIALREAMAGLLSFAAAEEQTLLAATTLASDDDRGGPDKWAAAPLVAQAGQPDEAARTLAEAIAANPDLRANAARDPDLAVLRESGRLSVLPSGGRAAQ